MQLVAECLSHTGLVITHSNIKGGKWWLYNDCVLIPKVYSKLAWQQNTFLT